MTITHTGVAALVASLAGVASAGVIIAPEDVVAGFTYNSAGSGAAAPTYAADYGVGLYSTNFFEGDVVMFTGTSLGAVTGDVNGRGAAFRVGESGRNNGAFAQFAFDTTGFADLALSFATKTTSGTGFTSMDIQVSGDGVVFTTLETLTNLRDDINWTLKSVDLSGVAALEDNTDAAIRVVFNGGDASNPVANTRLENVIITGAPVPAPGPAALLGLGGLVAGRRRRG